MVSKFSLEYIAVKQNELTIVFLTVFPDPFENCTLAVEVLALALSDAIGKIPNIPVFIEIL